MSICIFLFCSGFHIVNFFPFRDILLHKDILVWKMTIPNTLWHLNWQTIFYVLFSFSAKENTRVEKQYFSTKINK